MSKSAKLESLASKSKHLISNCLSGIRGLSVPVSLREQAARSLARFCNSEECLPPLGWFNYIECEVLIRLKPHLFIHFLYKRGKIMTLREDYSEIEFELVLNKLFSCYQNCSELPMVMRPLAVCQINTYMNFVRESNRIEHAFYLLGLRDKQDAQYRSAKQNQGCSVEIENVQCDFSHRILNTYRLHSDPNTCLVLPSSKALFDLTKNFEPEKQNFFLRDSDCDLRYTAFFLRLLEEYLQMNEFVKFCAVFEALEGARLKRRPHSAFYLCLYLLFEFQIKPELSKYKTKIFRATVESLVTFNCKYDMIFSILELMEKSIYRNSDYCQFVLAKQYFLSAAGFTKQETALFETSLRQKIFLEGSTYYRDFFKNHGNCMLRNCENNVLVMWLAKRDLRLPDCNAFKSYYYVVKNILFRLLEIFGPLRDNKITADLAEEILFRRRMLACVNFHIKGACYLARMESNSCLNTLPNTGKKAFYNSLLKAFLRCPPKSNVDPHFTSLKDLYDNINSEVSFGCDWQESLEKAEFAFEVVVFLVGTNMHYHCEDFFRQLHNDASEIYRKLSTLQKHPRLVLLELLGQHAFSLRRREIQESYFTIFAKQVISNLEVSGEPPLFLENANFRDIIRFYFRRDGHYLKNILGFGYQSVACNLGT